MRGFAAAWLTSFSTFAGILSAQSADDYPRLTPKLASHAILESLACPAEISVRSIREVEIEDELHPDMREVRVSVMGAVTLDLDVKFEWKWELTGEWNGEGDPPGRWAAQSFALLEKGSKKEAEPKLMRAVSEIRSLATAVEAYSIDHDLYPMGDGATLWRKIVPTYILRMPPLDPWGNPYRYETTDARAHYVLSSTGPGGGHALPESFFHRLAEAGPQPADLQPSVAPENEIVFADGQFIKGWIPETRDDVSHAVSQLVCGDERREAESICGCPPGQRP